MNKRTFVILIVLFITLTTYGQKFNEKYFDHFTTERGLSHNHVTDILQDSTGYVWITTSYGINRFNGSRFVQFHSSDDISSPAGNDMWGISRLGRNKVAVITTGLHIIDTRTAAHRNLFVPYHNRQYEYKFNMIQRAAGDEQGNIFVLSRGGFYHFDSSYKLKSRFDFYSEDEIPSTHFFFGRELFKIDKNRLLIVAIDGLYTYDLRDLKVTKMNAGNSQAFRRFLNYPADYYSFFQPEAGKFIIHKAATDSLFFVDAIENRVILSLLPFKPSLYEFHWRSRLRKGDDSTLYITGHKSGFYELRYNKTTGIIKMLPEKYFPSSFCTAVMRDKQKNLWVATSRGLFRQNSQRATINTSPLPASITDSFPNVKLDDIYVLGDKVYVAGNTDAGMFVFDKSTLQLKEQVLFKTNPKVNTVRSIAKSGKSTLLLGTNGPLVSYDVATKKHKLLTPPLWYQEGDWTNDIYTDHSGDIWIAAYHNYRLNRATGKFTVIGNPTNLLAVPFMFAGDTSGNIWMAGHGVARYNNKLASFDLLLDSFPYIKMPDRQINSIVVDRQGNVWLNSTNNGLIRYNVQAKKYSHFTSRNGLPDDNIGSMMVLGDRLWIAGFSGLACMDLKTFKILTFGKEDGFPQMPITRGARFFYDTTDKLLYIAFATAVVRFNPDSLVNTKPAPTIFFESVSIDGANPRFLPGEKVFTSYKNNQVRVNIGTINFSDAGLQRFAYRIAADSNSKWIPIGAQSSFSIANLPAGTHRIQVKVSAANNRWQEQISEMTLVVLPPVWEKDWFIALVTCGVLFLLYLFIEWRTKLATRKEMEKTHIEKLKADDYKNRFELEQISNYFSSSLADKKSVDDVLWDVAQNLVGRMNYEDFMIYLWNDDKTRMIQKAAYGPKGKPELIRSQVFDVVPGQGVVGYVVETQQPVLISDTRKDPRYRVDEKFRLSEICVPIIHNDELLGIIDSEHDQLNYYTERDLKILTTIATLIGNKLKQLEAEQILNDKQKELANINEQAAIARLAALQAQMNPHFVFNALNSIKRMILDGDNEKASRYLSKFAQMIRMTLNHSKEIFVTLDENIEYLRNYFEMEQLRFDDSFTFSIDVAKNIDVAETTIPSMMIQPLVENAIWHGLMQAEAEKKIKVCFEENQNQITCLIEDNGIGIRQAELLKSRNRPLHQSVGLENLRKRMKIMNEKYDMNCSIDIKDLSDEEKSKSGTRVVLRFNLVNS